MDKGSTLFHLCKENLDRGYNCCESTLQASVEYFKLDTNCTPAIGTVFGGGIAGQGHVCGAIMSTLMIIGLMYGRKTADDPKEKADEKADNFLQFCNENIKKICCKDICGIDFQNETFPSEKADRAFEERCLPVIEKILLWQQENL